MSKAKKKKPARIVVVSAVDCGGFRLSRLANGRLWLGNKAGEGMAVDERQMEKTLRGFFARNF